VTVADGRRPVDLSPDDGDMTVYEEEPLQLTGWSTKTV
jgi:hypothetical protein